ncbi:hypothetical protein [Chimaeribacter arupi]|nr:hypothetical protein [Chimaeribacter arupi]WKZ92471.1 hypothetical protein P0E69_00420 [Chimaeribacter arupi]
MMITIIDSATVEGHAVSGIQEEGKTPDNFGGGRGGDAVYGAGI